jgi:hypothetical protein
MWYPMAASWLFQQAFRSADGSWERLQLLPPRRTFQEFALNLCDESVFIHPTPRGPFGPIDVFVPRQRLTKIAPPSLHLPMKPSARRTTPHAWCEWMRRSRNNRLPKCAVIRLDRICFRARSVDSVWSSLIAATWRPQGLGMLNLIAADQWVLPSVENHLILLFLACAYALTARKRSMLHEPAEHQGVKRSFHPANLLSFRYFFVTSKYPVPKPLSDEAVEVLYVLWMERFRRSFFDEGLTPDEIRERTDDTTQFKRLSRDEVYSAIKELTGQPEKWITIAEVRKKTDASVSVRGKRPKAFVLYGDNASEWPRSSFLLMELNAFDKKRPRQIVAAEFCQHLLDNCGYGHQEDLDDIITGLCALDYLYRSPSLPTLPKYDQRGKLIERGYLILALNKRSQVESVFHRKVALHYPSEVEEDKRTIRHSLFLINDGYYKRNQRQGLEPEPNDS